MVHNSQVVVLPKQSWELCLIKNSDVMGRAIECGIRHILGTTDFILVSFSIYGDRQQDWSIEISDRP